MSYHIIINKNQNITYGQLHESSFVPDDVIINGEVETDDVIVGYNKFYLQNESSRGVAITVSDTSYDVELNICASVADYMLATKLALAIARINNSTISPEFDDELSLDRFEAQYDSAWAQSSRLNGVDTLKSLVQQRGEIKLPGCVRPYFIGNYVLGKISQDHPDEEQFADRIIDEIKNVQFIEQTVDGLEVPTVMESNFPEGVQTVQIVLPDYKLLIQKSDWIILRADGMMLKVDHQQFVQHTLPLLTRLDEAQYILQPIEKGRYLEIMKHFSLVQDQPADFKSGEPKSVEGEVQTSGGEGKWWQFWK